jgi:hypothetical protein
MGAISDSTKANINLGLAIAGALIIFASWGVSNIFKSSYATINTKLDTTINYINVREFESRFHHRAVIRHAHQSSLTVETVALDLSNYLMAMQEVNNLTIYRDSLAKSTEQSLSDVFRNFRTNFTAYKAMQKLALNQHTPKTFEILASTFDSKNDFDKMYALIKDKSFIYFHSEPYLSAYKNIIYPASWDQSQKTDSTLGIALLLTQIRYLQQNLNLENRGLYFMNERAKIFRVQRIVNALFIGTFLFGSVLLGARWYLINMRFWPKHRGELTQ